MLSSENTAAATCVLWTNKPWFCNHRYLSLWTYLFVKSDGKWVKSKKSRNKKQQYGNKNWPMLTDVLITDVRMSNNNNKKNNKHQTW